MVSDLTGTPTSPGPRTAVTPHRLWLRRTLTISLPPNLTCSLPPPPFPSIHSWSRTTGSSAAPHNEGALRSSPWWWILRAWSKLLRLATRPYSVDLVPAASSADHDFRTQLPDAPPHSLGVQETTYIMNPNVPGNFGGCSCPTCPEPSSRSSSPAGRGRSSEYHAAPIGKVS